MSRALPIANKPRETIWGVTLHAQQRQAERWPTRWDRAIWTDVVTQILDGIEGIGTRRAVLVRRAQPDRTEAVRRGGWDRATESECWLVEAPDGPARVWWVPREAVVSTVMGPDFSTRTFLRQRMHKTTTGAGRTAQDNRRAIMARIHEREDRDGGEG